MLSSFLGPQQRDFLSLRAKSAIDLPKFTGKGVGSELLKKVIEHAKQEKCTHIEAVPFNEKFFRDRGFVKGTSLADRMLNRYFFPLTPEMQNKLKVQEREMHNLQNGEAKYQSCVWSRTVP